MYDKQYQILFAMFIASFVILVTLLTFASLLLAPPSKLHAMSDQTIVSLLNAERKKAGLQPLEVNASLQRSSLVKGADMITKDYWNHNAPDGSEPWHFIDESGYTYDIAGENLAKNYITPESVVSGWMNSPAHRDNLLSPNYQDVGISALDGTLAGENTTLIVAHFGTFKPGVNALPSAEKQNSESSSTDEVNKPASQPDNMPVWRKFIDKFTTWYDPSLSRSSFVYDPRLKGLPAR